MSLSLSLCDLENLRILFKDAEYDLFSMPTGTLIPPGLNQETGLTWEKSLPEHEGFEIRHREGGGYNPEKCLTPKIYERSVDSLIDAGHNPRSAARCFAYHCLDYPNGLGPFCKYCKNWLPHKQAIKEMIDWCHYHEEEFYSLEKSTRTFKLLKDHLPEESKKEVDSCSYSIIPKERLPLEPLNLNALSKFCETVFNSEKHIGFSRWVVESGKHEDNPNPHIHAVVKFKDSANFARLLRDTWKEIFPDPKYTIYFKRYSKKLKRNVKGIDIYRCTSPAITADKIAYLDNDKKHEFGEDHTNYIDLGINGGIG